jgi:hypothetical protein
MGVGRILMVLMVIAAGAATGAAAADDGALPAYRVGTGTIRVALLPVRCTRDIAVELCRALDQSISVELGRDPRLDLLTPNDLEVLVGAQELAALQACDGDDCFNDDAFQQMGAAYTVAVVLGRIGTDAIVTVRLVDMRRGTVLDRDDARVARGDERAIDDATRALTRTVLARRGIGTPIIETVEDVGSGLFVTGALLSGVGITAVAGGLVVGGVGVLEATDLARESSVPRPAFDERAQNARNLALTGDLTMVGGGLCLLTGVVLMVVGSL